MHATAMDKSQQQARNLGDHTQTDHTSSHDNPFRLAIFMMQWPCQAVAQAANARSSSGNDATQGSPTAAGTTATHCSAGAAYIASVSCNELA